MQTFCRACVVMAIALLTLTHWTVTPALANTTQTQPSQPAQSYASEQKPYQSQQQSQFPQQKPYAKTSQTSQQSNPEASPDQSKPLTGLVQKIKQFINSVKG